MNSNISRHEKKLFQRHRAAVGLGLAFLLSPLLLIGCLTNETIEDSQTIPVKSTEKAFVLTVNSDYKTGSYSAFGIDSSYSNNTIGAITGDAAVRYLGGSDIYILNRASGHENIQVLDRHSLNTILQIPLPALSNPYDIALKDSLLYVGFFGAYPKIGIYKQFDGTKMGDIDLSSYADTIDHFPEVTELRLVGNTLYVLIANENNKTYEFLQAKLARIDLATKKIEVINLPIGNPLSLTYDSAENKMYIPLRGAYFKPGSYTDLELDGAIVSVNLAKFLVTDTVITEKALQGSLNNLLLNDGQLIMDLTTAAMEKLISIEATTTKVTDWASLDPYGFSGMDLDKKTNTLFIGDRTKGLRAFDLASRKENGTSNVSMGPLPISSLAVIR